METDTVNVHRLPMPSEPVPAGRLMDNKGRLVFERTVKPQQLLEDQMVRKVLGHAVELANQIRRFRNHVFADAEAFQTLLLAEYDIQKRGARGKGNVTFTSFDGLMKFQIAIGERIGFGPELQVAQAAFRSCIDDWTDGARDELRALVDQAFEGDKEGNISRDAVFRLLRVNFDDDRWKSGQNAIRDSIRVIGSKAYPRFSVRSDLDAEWQSIPIDLASSRGEAMACETKDDALSDAVKFLIDIKRRAEAVRLAPALAGGPTPESRALFAIEAAAEEWLNDLAFDHPELAGGWKVTPEYAFDRSLEAAHV